MTQSETLNGQLNVKETHKENSSDKIIEVEKIEGTPFAIITANNGKKNNTFIAIGDKRITEMQSLAESKKMIAERDWNIITALVVAVTNGVIKLETK